MTMMPMRTVVAAKTIIIIVAQEGGSVVAGKSVRRVASFRNRMARIRRRPSLWTAALASSVWGTPTTARQPPTVPTGMFAVAAAAAAAAAGNNDTENHRSCHPHIIHHPYDRPHRGWVAPPRHRLYYASCAATDAAAAMRLIHSTTTTAFLLPNNNYAELERRIHEAPTQNDKVRAIQDALQWFYSTPPPPPLPTCNSIQNETEPMPPASSTLSTTDPFWRIGANERTRATTRMDLLHLVASHSDWYGAIFSHNNNNTVLLLLLIRRDILDFQAQPTMKPDLNSTNQWMNDTAGTNNHILQQQQQQPNGSEEYREDEDEEEGIDAEDNEEDDDNTASVLPDTEATQQQATQQHHHIQRLHHFIRKTLSIRLLTKTKSNSMSKEDNPLSFQRILNPNRLSPDVLKRSSVHACLLGDTENDDAAIVHGLFTDPNKFVFGLFYGTEPVAILYVSLQATIPATLEDVWTRSTPPTLPPPPSSSVTTNASSAPAAAAATEVEVPVVATFYSIVANLQPTISGLGLGEHLIHQAVDYLKAIPENNQSRELEKNAQLHPASPPPPPSTFVTLSPMPGFRRWMMTMITSSANSNASPDEGKHTVVPIMAEVWDSPEDQEWIRFLSGEWKCRTEHDFVPTFFRHLQQSRGHAVVGLQKGAAAIQARQFYPVQQQQQQQQAMDHLILTAATRYLRHAKTEVQHHSGKYSGSSQHHQQLPLDSVARFHLKNGASLYRINLRADASDTGWDNSWGVMVNYLYDLDALEANQAAYQKAATHCPCRDTHSVTTIL